MNEQDTIFAFAIDARLKKRYQYLTLNKHVSKSYMAARLRATFLKALNEAEAAANLAQTSDAKLKRYADDEEEMKEFKTPEPPSSFVKKNLIGDGLVEAEGGEGVV